MRQLGSGMPKICDFHENTGKEKERGKTKKRALVKKNILIKVTQSDRKYTS
jgi:hypothetical protein